MPLIYAMHQGTARQREVIRGAIESGGRENLEEVIAAIEYSGAIQYTARAAQGEAAKARRAVQEIGASSYQAALEGLAEFAVARAY